MSSQHLPSQLHQVVKVSPCETSSSSGAYFPQTEIKFEVEVQFAERGGHFTKTSGFIVGEINEKLRSKSDFKCHVLTVQTSRVLFFRL